MRKDEIYRRSRVKQILTKQKVGAMFILYLYDTVSEQIGLSMVPESKETQVSLEGNWDIEPLVQIGLMGRNSKNSSMERMNQLNFIEQYIERKSANNVIVTELENQRVQVKHKIGFSENTSIVRITTEVTNRFINPIKINHLTSFSITGWPMYGTDIGSEGMQLYKLSDQTVSEFMNKNESNTNIQFESSWSRYGIQRINYNQVEQEGKSKYIPFGVVEDKNNSVYLSAMVQCESNWKMDIYANKDRYAICGGYKDEVASRWSKTLMQGECYTTPEVLISVVEGSVQECNTLDFSRMYTNIME